MNKAQKAQIEKSSQNIARMGEIIRTWKARRSSNDMAKACRIAKRYIRVYKGN